MSFWANAVEATRNVVTEDDFEVAANRLVTEQVLYAADRGSKVAGLRATDSDDPDSAATRRSGNGHDRVVRREHGRPLAR